MYLQIKTKPRGAAPAASWNLPMHACGHLVWMLVLNADPDPQAFLRIHPQIHCLQENKILCCQKKGSHWSGSSVRVPERAIFTVKSYPRKLFQFNAPEPAVWVYSYTVPCWYLWSEKVKLFEFQWADPAYQAILNHSVQPANTQTNTGRNYQKICGHNPRDNFH